jgi:hypothetical protein
VTAKEGTPLPFDVKDIPVVFWDNQKTLKEQLRKRIKAIARQSKVGRSIASNRVCPPYGIPTQKATPMPDEVITPSGMLSYCG